MWILLIVLIVTNLVTVGLLAWFALRPAEHPSPDEKVARSLDAHRPTASSSSLRRVITIEILNPIELAGTRGRWAGLAGFLAPGLTNRVVYDQAIKLVKRQLTQHHVVADVRLHVFDPSLVEPQGGPPSASSNDLAGVEFEHRIAPADHVGVVRGDDDDRTRPTQPDK